MWCVLGVANTVSRNVILLLDVALQVLFGMKFLEMIGASEGILIPYYNFFFEVVKERGQRIIIDLTHGSVIDFEDKKQSNFRLQIHYCGRGVGCNKKLILELVFMDESGGSF